jgi:hypothetical protein
VLITDPWFYAVAIPAVLLMGISKSGFGDHAAVAARDGCGWFEGRAVLFYRLVYAGMFLTGTKLLWDGLR